MLVLVVEDEPISALSATYELEQAGHLVVGPAATLSEALRLARRYQPQLALVDIDLENMGDGIELARHLRGLGIASVFMSAQHRLADRNSDLALGLLGKPFNPVDVPRSVAVIDALLQGEEPPPLPRSLQLFSTSIATTHH